MKEADSAACGKEDVKLGQQLYLVIQTAEWSRQEAPGVHTKEGNPFPARPDIRFPTGEPTWRTYWSSDMVGMILAGVHIEVQAQSERKAQTLKYRDFT